MQLAQLVHNVDNTKLHCGKSELACTHNLPTLPTEHSRKDFSSTP